MSHCIHHIPGRLRFKFVQLKNQPARARMVESAISQVIGVTSVEISILSGSLLIHYKATGAEREKLLASLERTMMQIGLISEPTTPAFSKASHVPAPAGVVTDKLLDMLMQKCIERSALALLGILL
jgi:hypothetical protein